MKNKSKAKLPTNPYILIAIGITSFLLLQWGSSVDTSLEKARIECNIGSMFGYNNPNCFWVSTDIGKMMMGAAYVGLIICGVGIFNIVKRNFKMNIQMSTVHNAVLDQPHNLEGYINRGDIFKKQGKNDLAIADYTKAIELDHNNYSARLARAMTYIHMSKWDNALDDVNNAIEHYRYSADAYFLRSVIYERMNELEKSLIDARRASDLDPKDIAYKNRLTKVKAKIDIDKGR